MAFTLAAFEADTTLTPVGMVGPFESLSDATEVGDLGPFECRTDITDRPAKLSAFIVGDDGPSSSTIVPSGGVVVNGEAPRSFVLDGIPTDDPNSFVITTSGGVIAGGDATETNVDVLRFEFVGTGFATVGGAATVAFDAIEFSTSGGVVVGGAAAESGVFPWALNSMSAVLPAMTASLDLYNVQGSMDVSLPSISAEATGELTNVGSISATLPTISAALEMGENTLDAALPAVSASLVGDVGVTGVMDVRIPTMTSFIAAELTQIGSMNVRMKPIRASGTAIAGVVGEIEARLPKIRSEFAGSVGVFGSMDVELDALVAAMVGYQQVTGSMEVSLPAMQAFGVSQEAVEFVQTLCVNTITTALSHYDNFEFNSMCEFNGMYLGASDGGLFQLDVGNTDAGEEIDALMSTGDLDFGNEYVKRLTDFYIGMRSDGDMTLRISTDEGEPVEYTLGTYSVDTLKQRRAKTAKGARGKYWRFEIQNTDGCDFEFDSMNAATVPTVRRI